MCKPIMFENGMGAENNKSDDKLNVFDLDITETHFYWYRGLITDRTGKDICWIEDNQIRDDDGKTIDLNGDELFSTYMYQYLNQKFPNGRDKSLLFWIPVEYRNSQWQAKRKTIF